MNRNAEFSGYQTPEEEFSEHPYKMTENKLRLRAMEVHKGLCLPQFFCALAASIGSLSFGLVLGWSSPKIRRHLDNVHREDNFPSVAGLAPLGASIGCALFQALCERRGPRSVVLVICPLQLICWVLLWATDNFTLIKWMIFTSGLLSIGFILCGETLLWDSVHVGYTTVFTIMFKSSLLLGVLISYMLGMSPSVEDHYSIAGAVIVSITFILFYCLPESPVYLYGKNPVKAERALTFLRGGSNFYEDMRRIRKDYELRAVDISAKYMFLKRVVYRAILVIIGVTFFREFTGYYALMAFGLTVLSEQGGMDEIHPSDVFGKFEDAVIMGLTFFISRIISCYMLCQGKYGVRKPLIISSVMVTIMSSLTTFFFYLDDVMNVISKENNYLKILLNCSQIFAYDIGYNMVPGILEQDYLPFQVYPWVKLLTMTCRWLFAYLVIMVIVSIGINQETTWENYMMLSVMSFLGIIFNCVFIIESKGKTLMQIQSEFGGNPVGSRSSRRNKKILFQEERADSYR